MIPPESSAEFVCQMEEVLDVYERPLDLDNPVVTIDETNKQLIEEVRTPLAAEAGQVQRVDYEYKRNGVMNLFMVFVPLLGLRIVEVTEQRTREDFGRLLGQLDEWFGEAKKITVVLDNLNTHSLASLYAAFEPEEAKRLRERFEFVHTPKHGSWLNMAEIELSVLQRQCLDRRIASEEELKKEVKAWQDERNEQEVTVNWQFRTNDARTKLKRLYPQIQPR